MSEERIVGNVTAMDIVGAPALDPIRVFWWDAAPGVGSVTITCYGAAWTAFFGAMPAETIREFFATANTDYLVTKLGITPHLYQRKRDHQYLARIIDAIKATLAPTREAA
jgi:hypothetical protein